MRMSILLLFPLAVVAFSAEVTVGYPETAGCNPMGIG
jgi:hypothetical protein